VENLAKGVRARSFDRGTANLPTEATAPIIKLLAIDDNDENLGLVNEALQQPGLEIITSNDPERGFELFQQLRPKVVLLDLVMPKLTGMQLLERMIAIDPGVDIVLMTAHYTPESAVEAIQKGACDYLTKPLNIQKLRARLAALLSEAERRRKTLHLDQQLLNIYQFEGMVGRSPLMLEVFARIRRVAPHFRTLLINGPTGSGKELVARALHRLSPAASGPFAVCNCSALVETLVESELFGYARGAFTGATQDKSGLFEYANGGTVFLDEIGELSMGSQAKLLRVLQNRQVQRVGSPIPRDVDVRVIAATNRNLKTMVREGRFREDLYYRLAMVDIMVPALADRREDLPLLQRYFLEKFSAEYNKEIAGISRRAQARLAAHGWPGNVRELENVIGTACMMTDTTTIDIHDLPEELRAQRSADSGRDDDMITLEELQKRHVLRVLAKLGGSKTRAAEVLGIGRATIYHLLARWKVDGSDQEPGEE
jgi:DNA-binding NtrC family response regulator